MWGENRSITKANIKYLKTKIKSREWSKIITVLSMISERRSQKERIRSGFVWGVTIMNCQKTKSSKEKDNMKLRSQDILISLRKKNCAFSRPEQDMKTNFKKWIITIWRKWMKRKGKDKNKKNNKKKRQFKWKGMKNKCENSANK